MIEMEQETRDSVLAVAKQGRTRVESLAFFRVAIGLVYLAGLMTSETIDFKKVDADFNRFIYQAIGKGHTITSVLQFMSGAKVVPVLKSARFTAAFGEHLPGVPAETIPFLLSLNLGVAKNISGIDIGGPLLDWIDGQKAAERAADVRGPWPDDA